MNHIWSIARKELRGYFNSAVALIFLGIFLGVTVFTFFWVEKFFARGLVDVRPMFEWFPVLLILLVSALTMRLWSEEQKTGTIEVLLTLPIRPRELVLGKFLAGLLLIAMALVLTLPIPVTVARMGDLDWGPVVGGYLAALLLASAYLSIGLCISSATDNQILALFGTGLSCGLLYLVGSDALVSGRSLQTAELLRALGSGSRFDSVARGVIDLRDLAYYGGFIASFLALNVLLIRSKRWSRGPRAAGKRAASLTTVGLVFANAVLLNLWLAPVGKARLDITEDKLYSLSPSTEHLLSSLDQPLLLRAYVSSTVHPKIDPLVPELVDLLGEYAETADGRVVLEVVDPDDDEDLQKEAEEQYGITPDQFEITTRKKQALVNAYFRILVEYGDQHEVLSYGELLEILPLGVDEVEVELGNIEYEISKAIRKTVYGFQSLDAIFASLGEPVVLTAYLSPDLAPELQSGLEVIKKIANEYEEKSGGQMTFATKEPDSPEEKEELAARYGLRPFTALRSGEQGMQLASFYYHLILQVGERAILINPPEDLTEQRLREVLDAALEQAMPGFIKTIGLVAPSAPPVENPQLMMQMGRRPPPPPQSFAELRNSLAQLHEVKDVSLESGNVSEDVDVLLLAGPENLKEDELRAIDQFLMRGGAVIALVGSHRLDLQSPGLTTQAVESGLGELLKSYGVELSKQVVLDENAGLFATIDARRRRLEPIEAPYVIEVPRSGLENHLATSNLVGLLAPHASPLTIVEPKDGRSESYRAEVLAHSSDASWLGSGTDLRGTPARPDDLDAGEENQEIIGVAISGSLTSHFATSDAGDSTGTDEPPSAEPTERLLQQSPPDARLVVLGSSSMFADAPLQLAQQLSRAGGSRLWRGNLPLLQNLIDWATEDTDLLAIRARSAESRILEIDESEQGKWEVINYGFALALVLGLFALTLVRRRTLTPMTLDPRRAGGAASASADGDKQESEA